MTYDMHIHHYRQMSIVFCDKIYIVFWNVLAVDHRYFVLFE